MGRLTRLFIFLIVLAVAIGGLLLWWQANAARVITETVHERARNLVVNPENLTVDLPKAVQMVSLRQALVPTILISGKNLELHEGPTVADATIKLEDISVAGPPFGFKGLTNGTYALTFKDTDVTTYLRKRGVKFAAVAKMPLDTLTVKFASTGVHLTGEWNAPLVGRIPLSAKGTLVPSSRNGEIDLKIASSKDVKLSRYAIGVEPVVKALSNLNPVVSVSEWPFMANVTKITFGNGTITIYGTVTDL